MELSKEEYDAIINDDTKVISENIEWQGHRNSPSRKFRVNVDSVEEHPIFVSGWYNLRSGKLSFAIVHRTVGQRIYGLDLGAEHYNPDDQPVGEKHKNYWVPGSRDKWAYVPADITAPWDRPVEVWRQFCAEANIKHTGTIQHPNIQREILL